MAIDVKDVAAQTWFGYGRWDAPYWFVGMEPGGEDDHASYETWQQLGGTELIDCRAHHLNPEHPEWAKWHTGDRPPTQATWRRLIQLLLAYQGKPTDLDAVSHYQRDEWGSETGETAVVEVSSIHAPNLGSEADRLAHRESRIATLHQRIVEHKPTFVVMYGLTYRDVYSQIVGAPWEIDGFAWCGSTLCALVEHPTAIPGKPEPWWVDKGRELRDMLARR